MKASKNHDVFHHDIWKDVLKRRLLHRQQIDRLHFDLQTDRLHFDLQIDRLHYQQQIDQQQFDQLLFNQQQIHRQHIDRQHFDRQLLINEDGKDVLATELQLKKLPMPTTRSTTIGSTTFWSTTFWSTNLKMSKSMRISVEVDVHAVTCPGLLPKSKLIINYLFIKSLFKILCYE